MKMIPISTPVSITMPAGMWLRILGITGQLNDSEEKIALEDAILNEMMLHELDKRTDHYHYLSALLA